MDKGHDTVLRSIRPVTLAASLFLASFVGVPEPSRANDAVTCQPRVPVPGVLEDGSLANPDEPDERTTRRCKGDGLVRNWKCRGIKIGIKSADLGMKVGKKSAKIFKRKKAKFQEAWRQQREEDGYNHDDSEVRDFLRAVRETARRDHDRGGTQPEAEFWQSDVAFVWPVDEARSVISSEYGPRWNRQHRGIDIAGESGTPIRAAAPGKVIYSGNGLGGYGNVLIVQHDTRLMTLYAHNDELLVSEGQSVAQGEKIAHMGSTGRSTGPHLHFEVRDGDERCNPRVFLPADQFAPAAVALDSHRNARNKELTP